MIEGIKTISLEVHTATPEVVRPFGELLGVGSGTSRTSAFYDEKVVLHSPSHFISDGDTEVTVARLKRRPMRVRWMERHFKHTQAFVPLAGRPFLMVLAPPSEDEMPDLPQAKAVLFDGSAGFAMHLGTWHEFPFALVDDSDLLVILRREATRGLMHEAIVDGESRNPDIDKKDVARRTGTVFEVKV